MIDWFYLFSNAFWIIGLALALAVVSYGQWQKQEEKITWSAFFERVQPRRILLVAGLLFTLGLGFNVDAIWQKGIWFVLAGAALVYFILSIAKPGKAK